MREGIQTLLAELGEAACLALCICELGKPGISEGEALDLILEAIRRGYIDYDEANRDNPDNCFVAHRDELMELVTGEKGWKSTTESPDYAPKQGDKCIECWIWNEQRQERTMKHQHFRLRNWDPYKNSLTIQHGYLQSLRVFRRKI